MTQAAQVIKALPQYSQKRCVLEQCLLQIGQVFSSIADSESSGVFLSDSEIETLRIGRQDLTDIDNCLPQRSQY